LFPKDLFGYQVKEKALISMDLLRIKLGTQVIEGLGTLVFKKGGTCETG